MFTNAVDRRAIADGPTGAVDSRSFVWENDGSRDAAVAAFDHDSEGPA